MSPFAEFLEHRFKGGRVIVVHRTEITVAEVQQRESTLLQLLIERRRRIKIKWVDHSVNMKMQQVLQAFAFPLPAVIGGGDDEPESVSLRFVQQRLRITAGVAFRNLPYHQPDDTAAPGFQAAGMRIRSIAAFPGKCEDPVRYLRMHAPFDSPVQNARNRRM